MEDTAIERIHYYYRRIYNSILGEEIVKYYEDHRE